MTPTISHHNSQIARQPASYLIIFMDHPITSSPSHEARPQSLPNPIDVMNFQSYLKEQNPGSMNIAIGPSQHILCTPLLMKPLLFILWNFQILFVSHLNKWKEDLMLWCPTHGHIHHISNIALRIYLLFTLLIFQIQGFKLHQDSCIPSTLPI